MKPNLLRLIAGLALVAALVIAGRTLAAGTYVEQVLIVGKDLTL